MNKLNSDEIFERTANFLDQLVIDNFKVTDPHEFLVLATYYKNTDFYLENKEEINLEEYKDIKDVYQDMMFKIKYYPFLARFTVAGLIPVMYDKYMETTK